MDLSKKVSTAERRANRERYFKEQDYTTVKYVVPYIEKVKKLGNDARVLEIGCGEAGNLRYFVSAGYDVVGIDLNEKQIERAAEYLDKYCDNPKNVQLIHRDIYEINPSELGQFDVIMMRDVIEHIPNQQRFLAFLHQFIKDDGVIFFGFPPWYMPFGGHQQGCVSVLRKVPYFHILPAAVYAWILRLFGESERRISSLLQTKSTGISIERFRRIVQSTQWDIADESLYLINPNYDVKFKLQPRKQLAILTLLPGIRNLVSTCAYYLIKPGKKV